MQKRVARQRISFAQNDRVGNYLNGVAYFDKGAAKELRLNNLEEWFMGKIHAYRDEMLGLQHSDFRLYAVFDIVLSVVMAAQAFCILWILSSQYIGGAITIADFTMYFSAVTVISASLSKVIEKIGEYNRMRQSMSDFDSVSAAGDTGSDRKISKLKDMTIRFENVSFAYPGSGQSSPGQCSPGQSSPEQSSPGQLILENVSIEIPANEKLAIVGENGADIWDIAGETYNKILSAVFQDYINFSFTIGENVAMCEDAPEEKTVSVLAQAGLSERISRLPGGIHTFLSKKFDKGGIELSGGEGQKLATHAPCIKTVPL